MRGTFVTDIDFIMGLINAKVDSDARKAGVWTIERLIDELDDVPAETVVVTDVMGLDGKVTYPGEPHSYRGYYERLALEPSNREATAGELRKILADTIGDVFEGYKGGDYEMAGWTLVHIAAYGSTGPYVCGVSYNGENTLVVETAYEEW